MRSGVVLSSAEDVDRLVSSLAALETDTIVDVDYVYDSKKTIERGLWPYPLTSEDCMSDWLAGLSFSDIDFWHHMEGSNDDFSMYKRWIYRTMDTWKKDAISSASSQALILYSPDLLYRGSKRPKTDMSLFRMPTSRTIRRYEIQNDRVIVDGEIWNVLPVTRYASGMSKGLYFEERPEGTCGTFYYYEPESSTYLAYRMELSAFNKTEAMIALGLPVEESTERALLHSRGPYPRDLMMTPNEAYRHSSKRRPMSSDVSPLKHYAGVYLELYGIEDIYDQDLCIVAAERGYDIVLLESMVGRFQVVTEILDTRSREDSFSSLLYVIDARAPAF